MAGVNPFIDTFSLDVKGLEPRVDSPSFSMMAWVQLKKGQGANIIRKSVGKTPEEKPLSCWAWYVGAPQESFSFGGHGENSKQ